MVWVRLESDDDDPIVLLRTLARALADVVAIDPAIHESLGSAVPPVRERVLPLLVQALAAAEPFLLVLDDAQAIASGKSWDVVELVLGGLPPGAQLVVGTRTDPQLPLPRLRAAGELAEVRFSDPRSMRTRLPG